MNPSPWPLSRFQSICNGDTSAASQVLLGESAARVLGFIVVSQVLDEGSIDNLVVATASQRRGIGHALVTAGITQLRGVGVTRCMLEVRASNGPARQLYERFGFTTDGLRKNYYRTGSGREDAYLMSLQLTAA